MKRILSILLFVLLSGYINAQSVAINTDGSVANASALLDIKSTTKGMLVPRMTTAQRTIISSPATGLLVYDTDVNSFWFYNGTSWVDLSGNGGGGGNSNSWNQNGNNIYNTNSGSVGIGTSTPNSASSLDMGYSGRPMVLPRLTSEQIDAINSPVQGMMVYNSTEHQLYSYMKYRTMTFPLPGQSNSRWQPVSTGPRILAWGVVDSFGTTITGGGTHTVTYDENNHWYRLGLISPHGYYKDSMLLIITAVGNGSWDQAIATGELIESTQRLATIKFVDISRMVLGWSEFYVRRRSNFHFVLYDLRKDPYN